MYDFQTFIFSTRIFPLNRTYTNASCVKTKKNNCSRGFFSEVKGSTDHSTETTGRERGLTLPIRLQWNLILLNVSRDSHGFFPSPSGFSLLLQTDKLWFPITGWLFHCENIKLCISRKTQHVTFWVFRTAHIPLFTAFVANWSTDCCPQYLKASLPSVEHLPIVWHVILFDAQWLEDVHIIEAADPQIHSFAQDPRARQWGSWDLAHWEGPMADGKLRGQGVAPKWEASRECDSTGPPLLLLSISNPPSSTQVSLLPTPDGDWGARCALIVTSVLCTDIRMTPGCHFHNLSLWFWVLSKALNISGFKKLSNCCFSVPVGLTWSFKKLWAWLM